MSPGGAVARARSGCTRPSICSRTTPGRRPISTPWLADAIINRDRNLRLQYLAGMGFNLYQSEAIYADMLQYSRYPEDLFVGSDATKQALRAAIMRMQGK